MIELPEEIIRHILEYNADFHPNLLKCHKELMDHRPQYYKKVIAGFKPGIGDHPTWHNFKKNDEITIHLQHRFNQYAFPDRNPILTLKLKLHAIEITGEMMSETNRRVMTKMGYVGTWRNINLYYGWDRNIKWDIPMIKGCGSRYMNNDCKPGYY